MKTTGIKYGESVFILDLVDQVQRREFEDLLWSTPGNASIEWPPHVARILQLVDLCRTAVVESEYVDTDHRLSYSRLYNLRHADTPRRCTRIHLFACTVSRKQLDDMPKETSKSYRGFLVIRPLSTDRLGRTILSPELFKKVDDLDVYLTCRASYEVSLVGNTISFIGVPWMEQEKLVSRCASAALWIASWHLTHRFRPEFRLFHTPEITDLATESGSQGLSVTFFIDESSIDIDLARRFSVLLSNVIRYSRSSSNGFRLKNGHTSKLGFLLFQSPIQW